MIETVIGVLLPANVMSCVRAINPLDFSFCVKLQSNGPVLGLFQREPRRRLFSLRPFF